MEHRIQGNIFLDVHIASHKHECKMYTEEIKVNSGQCTNHLSKTKNIIPVQSTSWHILNENMYSHIHDCKEGKEFLRGNYGCKYDHKVTIAHIFCCKHVYYRQNTW